MELSLNSALERPTDSQGPEPGATPAKPRRPHRRTRPRLLTRDDIDNRSKTGYAVRMFDNMVSAITADLGGRDQLTAMEIALVEAFAGEAVSLHNINTRLLCGEKVSLSDQGLAASTMVRVATRLGLQRRAKDITNTPSAEEYFAHKQKLKEQANGAPKPDAVCT